MGSRAGYLRHPLANWSGSTPIVVMQTTQNGQSHDLTRSGFISQWNRDALHETLMGSRCVVVLHELSSDYMEMPLIEDQHVV
jgi:hypothetical protein